MTSGCYIDPSRSTKRSRLVSESRCATRAPRSTAPRWCTGVPAPEQKSETWLGTTSSTYEILYSPFLQCVDEFPSTCVYSCMLLRTTICFKHFDFTQGIHLHQTLRSSAGMSSSMGIHSSLSMNSFSGTQRLLDIHSSPGINYSPSNMYSTADIRFPPSIQFFFFSKHSSSSGITVITRNECFYGHLFFAKRSPCFEFQRPPFFSELSMPIQTHKCIFHSLKLSCSHDHILLS